MLKELIPLIKATTPIITFIIAMIIGMRPKKYEVRLNVINDDDINVDKSKKKKAKLLIIIASIIVYSVCIFNICGVIFSPWKNTNINMLVISINVGIFFAYTVYLQVLKVNFALMEFCEIILRYHENKHILKYHPKTKGE